MQAQAQHGPLVMDVGGCSIKVGWASPDAANPELSTYRCIPNCSTRRKGDSRSYIADQLEERDDTSSLLFQRPFEKGYLCNWDAEREIWDRIFSKDVMNIEPSSTDLLLTEPPFNFPLLRHQCDEVVNDIPSFSLSHSKTYHCFVLTILRWCLRSMGFSRI